MMKRSRFVHSVRLALVLAGMLLLFSRCDVPTEAPEFSFTTGVRTPTIFDQSFVFMGPGEDGLDALIDTTSESFDSLFTVDASDQSIFIIEELDDFDIGDLDDVLPAVDMQPVDVAVDLGDLEDQHFETSFYSELGVFETEGETLPTAPLIAQNGEVSLEVPADQLFSPPKFDLVETDDDTPGSITLTDDADGVNAFRFTLANNLGQTLTDGTGSAAPVVIVEDANGTELGRDRFDQQVASGSTAEARVSVAGQTLSDLTFRFDISTPGGFAPIENNPGTISLDTQIEPLRYSETVMNSIPAQNDIDASQPEIVLEGDTDFTGIVTSSGQLTITVTNRLAIPVRMETLELRNLDAVGSYPANHLVGSATYDGVIQPGASQDIPMDLSETAIAARLEVRAIASSDGLNSPATLRADDGLAIDVTGDVQVDELYFTPESEDFTDGGLIDLDIDDVSFDGTNDFIELKEGTLEIDRLVNEMDITLSTMQISLPEIREAPYGPADSLVITFAGSTDDPAAHKFRGIAAKSTVEGLAVDLTNMRIYPRGEQLTYHVAATSAASKTPSTLRTTDRIRASISGHDMQVRRVEATFEPFSMNVTDDANDDGRLDLLADDEAVVSEFGDFSELNERLVGDLAIRGSELTLTVTTNLTTDLDLYAAIIGTTDDGERVFLSGKDAYAVSDADTMAGDFVLGGTPIQGSQLIRFTLEGANSPKTPRTHTIVLSDANSTVDAFVGKLPETLRFASKAVVGSNSRATLEEPFTLETSLGASIPLQIGGAFAVEEVVEADLSDLEDLDDPNEDIRLDEAALLLTYENGIPLGIDARLEVLDPVGNVLLTLPHDGDEPLRLEAAPVDESGAATGPRSGRIEFPVTRDELDRLSQGDRVRLHLSVETSDGSVSRLRATDQIRISLKGNIRLNVHAGN